MCLSIIDCGMRGSLVSCMFFRKSVLCVCVSRVVSLYIIFKALCVVRCCTRVVYRFFVVTLV